MPNATTANCIYLEEKPHAKGFPQKIAGLISTGLLFGRCVLNRGKVDAFRINRVTGGKARS